MATKGLTPRVVYFDPVGMRRVQLQRGSFLYRYKNTQYWAKNVNYFTV